MGVTSLANEQRENDSAGMAAIRGHETILIWMGVTMQLKKSGLDSKRTGTLRKNVRPGSRTIVGRNRLNWSKEGSTLHLYHRNSLNPLASVKPDSNYTSMFRVRYPNGKLSDFVNLARAKDAAVAYALLQLNSKPQDSRSKRVTDDRETLPALADPADSTPTREAATCFLAYTSHIGPRTAENRKLRRNASLRTPPGQANQHARAEEKRNCSWTTEDISAK